MKHIRKSLWALALLVPFFAQGQERLEPCAFAWDYDRVCIEKLVHKGYDFFYMRCPSFFAESALSLQIPTAGPANRSLLTYSTAEESIWYAKKRHKVKVTTSEMRVPDSVARRLRLLANHAIVTASPWADQRMLCDGTGYYFCNRMLGAMTHSPDSGARTFLLVQAMDSVCLAVVHSDTALLLRQMPMLDSLDRCFRQDYPLEAFMPDFKPWPFTDSTGVMHLQLYRNECFMNIIVADSADAAAQTPPMLDFYQQLAREIFIRYPDYRKLSVMVDPRCIEPRCKVVTREYNNYQYLDQQYRIYYTLELPPSMLTLERCLKALELPDGEHRIE